MKNSTLILFAVWILFAILDIVALFVNMPLAFSIIFAILNGTVVLGSIPIFIQEFKDRKYRKYLDAWVVVAMGQTSGRNIRECFSRV